MVNSFLVPFSFLIKDVKFLFHQVVIDHFVVQEEGHFEHLSSVGVHKIFKDNRDNVGQADMLIDDSTVGKAGQSQTLGVFQQADLVDKMFSVETTDLYNFTIFCEFYQFNTFSRKKGTNLRYLSWTALLLYTAFTKVAVSLTLSKALQCKFIVKR